MTKRQKKKRLGNQNHGKRSPARQIGGPSPTLNCATRILKKRAAAKCPNSAPGGAVCEKKIVASAVGTHLDF